MKKEKFEGIEEVRKELTDKALIEFFKDFGENRKPMAMRLIADDLKEGKLLEEIFTIEEGNGGHYIYAEKDVENSYLLTCGFSGGEDVPCIGDSGTWNISLDKDGKIDLVILVDMAIS